MRTCGAVVRHFQCDYLVRKGDAEALNSERCSMLERRALVLSWLNLIYNVAEGVISIIAGAIAGSTALIGFGLDSAVESVSSVVMIWRFGSRRELSEKEKRQREERAERFVGYTFFLLGGYILYEAVEKLLVHETANPSVIGIVVAAISLLLMPILAYVKRRIGEEIGSRSLVADSKETLACSWLSAALLLGLGANYLWSVWWADPVAGLIIAGFLFKEGYEIIFEDDDEDDQDDDSGESEVPLAGECGDI